MLKSKLILFVLVCLSITINAQDTIITKDNKTIFCKVTKISSANIFYTEKGIGKSWSLKDVIRYTEHKQIRDKQIEEDSLVLVNSNFILVEQQTLSLFGFIKFRSGLFENTEGRSREYPDATTMLSEMKSKGYKLLNSPYTYPNTGFLILFCHKTTFIFEKEK